MCEKVKSKGSVPYVLITVVMVNHFPYFCLLKGNRLLVAIHCFQINLLLQVSKVIYSVHLKGSCTVFVEEFLWPLIVVMVLPKSWLCLTTSRIHENKIKTIWTLHFSTSCFILTWIKSKTNQKNWVDIHFMLFACLVENEGFFFFFFSFKNLKQQLPACLKINRW